MQKARDQCSTMVQRLLEKSFSSRISLWCNKILLRLAWKHKHRAFLKFGGLACSWSLTVSLTLDFTLSNKLRRCAANCLFYPDKSKSCRW